MNKSIIKLIMAMSFAYGHTQNSLSGTIVDLQNKEPIAYAEIYFPKLEKGSVSDKNGHFEITNLPNGSYRVIASYIGFQTFSKTIEVTGGQNTLHIELSPSAIEMEEVIVSTPFHRLQRENVMKVERADIGSIKSMGATTLSNGITNIAGVSSVSTGVGIGKPVIRGLSGNRVLVYTQGVRLENQQFGDEHGLGINEAGIESVEVIKGPASLLYGSDALGGVLYLNPEKFARANETVGDVNLDYFSNTQGYAANAGVKSSGDTFRALVRGSTTSHIDYKAGNGLRTTNSRFKENDLKAGLAYQMTTFKTEFRYNFTESTLGIPETLGEQTRQRLPVLPYQQIDNHIVSNKTNIFFKKTSLEAIVGYTFNNRKEFEEHHDDAEEIEPDGEEDHGAALDMNLKTFNYNLQYHLSKWNNLETILGLQGMYQTNKNFGEEVLIPNANTTDIGIFATSHVHFKNDSDLQLGLRYDHRSIVGEAYGISGEVDFISELDKRFDSFNVAAGYKWLFYKNMTGRLNLATGFRAPNLAELTSNGVHEGTNRFEIGNPGLGNEQNFQTDISIEYKSEHFELFANGFNNAINDYIFIAPNGDSVGEDPVFIYRQQDARLYGIEMGMHLHPHPLDWLHIESTFENVTGKLDDGDYLPLIPANSLTNTLRIELERKEPQKHDFYSFVTLNSFLAQNKPNSLETPTDGYHLLNLGFGGSIFIREQQIDFRISGNNMLNQTYISHLSRLKTDGIANIGRNINLGLHIPF